MAEPVGAPELLEPSDHPVEIPGYTLIQRLGSGGMGDVWLAEQMEPVRREVALKVIRRGMDTEQVVARFEAERQALALMSHHNVARVFDAGTTNDGRPFFAMEHVEGVPITEYCDRHRLTTRQRLELLQQVCLGVQHAHQKGIIHRDIKPNNVLVQVEEGAPVPKIIDFGIAKATQQRLTEQTIQTQMGLMIGTPGYMSPEQAELSTEDIDTRTDVYSLGVLLYELLVGARPFESSELQRAAFDEIRRRICEQEPARPSQRVGTRGDESTATAERRRTDVSTLRRQLQGDLDWIVMKALEKDRARRYDSPVGLASDIGRHLSHVPVIARPPSAVYQTVKFARRHRVGVGVAGLLLVVLVAFTVTTTIQYRRIAVEAETAEQVIDFLTGLFAVSNPSQSRGEKVKAQDILDQGAREIEERLTDQPVVQARLMDAMGGAYYGLGLHEQAQPLLEKSTALWLELRGDSHLRTLGSRTNLASVYLYQGQLKRAEEIYLESLTILREEHGEEHPETVRALGNLASVYIGEGRYDEAEKTYLEAIELQERVLGAEHLNTLTSINNLAGVYLMQARFAKADSLFLENLEVLRRVVGEDHPETLAAMGSLAQSSVEQGRVEEGESLHLEAIEGMRRVLGDDHLDTQKAITNLASLYLGQMRLAEAEPLFLENVESLPKVVGEEHRQTLTTKTSLAYLYRCQGRADLGEPLARQALEIGRRTLGEEAPSTLWSMTVLAQICQVTGQDDDADELLRELVEIKLRVLGAEHRESHAALLNLATFVASHGLNDEAMELIEQAIDNGFGLADWLLEASAFQPLHGPEFDALVERARENAR